MPHRLPKCEGKGLHARITEFDPEGAFLHRAVLADQLVQTLGCDSAKAFGIRVHAMGCAGRLAVQRHAKADRFCGLTGFLRAQHQMQVARLEAELTGVGYRIPGD